MIARGYAYVEVLIAAIVLAGALVPASEALRNVMQNSTQASDQIELYYEAYGAFEMLLAQPYGQLNSEAVATGGTVPSNALSEPPGTPNRILVWVARHDLDNADGDDDPLTGVEGGVLRVRLEMEGTSNRFDIVVGRS